MFGIQVVVSLAALGCIPLSTWREARRKSTEKRH
jgi:hypothetical protein